jgi:hypothetical protein
MHKEVGMMKTRDERTLFNRQFMLYGNNLRNGEKDGKEQRNLKKYVNLNFWITHV